MKQIRLAALCGFLLVAANAQAFRVLEVLERSYELRLSQVSLPESTLGKIGYSSCATCARKSMAVSNDTLYFINGQKVTLAQMRQEAVRILRAAGTRNPILLVLHYDPDTEVATRVRIEND
jgi:hypothetical protein